MNKATKAAIGIPACAAIGALLAIPFHLWGMLISLPIGVLIGVWISYEPTCKHGYYYQHTVYGRMYDDPNTICPGGRKGR